MKRQGYGRIVNMSSFSGRNYSRFLGSPYAAAKAAILGFTRQMAVELGPYGICVNAVAPNFTLNERAKAKWRTLTDEERQHIISGIPLRRLAIPEEIAAAIAFLASDDASYVTGVCVDVNGGSYMT
jgi:3-oxoacyl-[acyl-carrier protein] reductase